MKMPFFSSPVPSTFRGHKYPIQRDDEGRSLRQRCFELFKQGGKPRKVAVILGAKLATARRYYSEWNRCPPVYEEMYRQLKKEIKSKGDLSPRMIGTLSTVLGMPEWQIVEILSRPNGLKSLLMGKLVTIRKRQLYSIQEQRLEAALHLVVFLERTGIPLELIHREINQLMQRAVKYTNAHKGEDQSKATENNMQIP